MVETQNITYEVIQGNIHQITLHRNTRQTVDDIFTQVTKINATAATDETMLYLFDSKNVKDLPFRYVIQLVDKWKKEQVFIPPARNIILYGTNTMMRYMVNMLVDISKTSGAVSRIFHPDSRDEAIIWLRSNN